MNTSFYFYTEAHLVKLLGLKAKNIVELMDGLKKVPESSVYYHTHRFLQQHHYLTPEPTNDFAYWITNILNQEELSEAFSSVDVVSFKDLEELRLEFIRILEEYISKGSRIVDCPAGHEFYFMGCITFVLPTPYVAHNLKEFIEIVKEISINSLYFHIFEARMRLKRDDNDFTAWFKSIGEVELAKELSKLDPYTMTLEGLRKKIIKEVSKYA